MKRHRNRKAVLSLFKSHFKTLPLLKNKPKSLPCFALKIIFLCCAFQLLLFPNHSNKSLKAQELRNALHYYRQAQDAYKSKDFHRAIDLYRNALESNPRHTASYMGAAKTYDLLGIYTQAEKSYRNLLKYLPRHQRARTGLAQVLMKTGKMGQAYKILRAVQKEDSADTENNYVLGFWHLKKGNHEQARRYFQRTLDLNPSHVPSLIKIAQLLITQKRLAQAEAYIKRASAIEPAHPALYETRGQLSLALALAKDEKQSRMDLIDHAYKSFLIAKKLSPQNVKIKRRLLYLDIYRKRFDEAANMLRELKTELAEDPKLHYLEALLNLENSKKDKKTLRSSIQKLKKALDLNPKNSYIRHTLENTILDHRDLKGAGPLAATLATYHSKEAKYQKSKYRHDRAQSHLGRALHLDPLSLRSLNMHLERLKKSKDYEGLLFVYQQLLRKSPNDPKLRYRSEKALRKRKQNIAYREKLFNPFLSTQKPSFRRSSKRIFVFSFKSQDFFAEYPDLSEQIGRALNMELNQRGPLQGLKEKTRAAILRYIQAVELRNNPSYKIWGLPYQSKYIHHVHEALKGKEKAIHYFISGTYRNTPSGILYAAIKLREGNTGTIISQFSMKTEARNSIIDLARQSRETILKKIPIEGEIIKIRDRDLFVNLGSYDGVKAQSHFSLPSFSKRKPALKVEEAGAYISRLRPLKSFQKQKFVKGLLVRLLPHKN